MKTTLKITAFIILIAAAVYITRRWFPSERVVTKTTTTVDTVWQDSVVYKQLPAPEPDTIIETDTIVRYKDSVNYFNEYRYLYKLYHQENVYNRTLKDDSTAYIYIEDRVKRNQLQDFSFKYVDRTPTVINKTIHKKIYNENKLFVGGQVGQHNIQPSIIYQTNKDMMYQLGYDFMSPSGIRAGVYMRLW